MRTPLALAALLALAAGVAPSAQSSVRDSVRMTLGVYQYAFVTESGGYNCGAGVYAVWPNVLQDLLGSPTRTYGYRDYGRVATDGMYIPGGYGEATSNPGLGLVVPEGYVGHNPQLGGGGYSLGGGDGSIPASCANFPAGAYATLGGGWGLLNAAPFRVTDWYATFSVPSGTPIALFEWEPADGLAVDFDGSFESGQSREIDAAEPTKKRPVASYAWDFGDGGSGAGATPTHTYDEPGEYVVRLVVTDDDGEEAAREETVTVQAAHLTVTVEAATERVVKGDTITVTAQVTNSGSEPVFGVRAARLFTYRSRLADSLNVRGGQPWGPGIEAVEIPAGQDSDVYAARLDPGESVEVVRAYRVESAATYRNVVAGEPWRPEDIHLDWTQLFRVEGETPEADSVEVRQPCAERDARCATTLVTYPVIEADLQGSLAFADVTGGGPVTAGLTYNEQIEDASFYAFGADGPSVGCVSGCVEVEVAVTADGEPAGGARVRLFVPALEASETVTARPHGNWLVAPHTQTGGAPARDNGSYLDVTTDAEGRAHAFYFAPGVMAATPVTIRAEIEDRGGQGEAEIAFTLQPNRPDPAAWDADVVTTAYLRVLAKLVNAAGAVPSVGDLCESSVGWLRAEAPLIGDGAIDDATSLRRNTTLYLSNLGTSAVCGWLIGKLERALSDGAAAADPQSAREAYDAVLAGDLAEYFAEVDGAAGDPKKFAQSHLFLYLLHELDLGGKLLGLALPSPEPPPLYATFQGEAYENLLKHLVDVMAASADGSQYRVEVAFDELSALNAGASYTAYDALLGTTMTFSPLGGPAQTFRDRSRVQYQPAVFLDTDPDGLTWVQEAVVTVGGAIPAAVGEVVVGGIDGLSQSIEGAIVQIGEGAESEINQIVGASGGRRVEGGQAFVLAAPTLFAYPEGTEIRVVARGVAGPPPAPLPSPTWRPRELVRLAWLPGASIATHYDVEVATDTLFSTVVVSREALTTLSTDLTADDVERDRVYVWRVRAANAAGDGPWSAWQPVLVNDQPTADDAAPEAPSAVALGTPYPNPTRGRAEVVVALPEAAPVRLALYDALGREVAVAHGGPLGPGRHALALDVGGLPAGVYVVRLEAGGEGAARRLTVVR